MAKTSIESFSPQLHSPADPSPIPNESERASLGNYRIDEARLLPKPRDVASDHIAYNPSAIWTIAAGNVMYVRVEPDRADSMSSHLGKAVVRPYLIDPADPEAELMPYDDADEMVGEDAALTRINRRLPISNELEEVWLLSYVDPKPKPDKPNEVATLCTRFWCGKDLSRLEHVADGPEGMKDIRIACAVGVQGTELSVYGRPQTQANSGNITHVKIDGIDSLTPELLAAAPYIDEKLLPIGSGVWGGVNDVVRLTKDTNILLAHRAWRQGADGTGRHYEAVLYAHNTANMRIVDLGILATANMFPAGKVKSDTGTDLSDVVFTGGGYNGGLDYTTFGVRDGTIGIGKPFRF